MNRKLKIWEKPLRDVVAVFGIISAIPALLSAVLDIISAMPALLSAVLDIISDSGPPISDFGHYISDADLTLA